MPLEAEDTHFDLDGWGGWIWPYRVVQADLSPIEVRVTARNPLPHEAELTIRLVGPDGWVGTTETLRVAAHGEATCHLAITPADKCRRQPIAAELLADGRPFGQVAEALVTIAHDLRW
jgi:hypothetical protein